MKCKNHLLPDLDCIYCIEYLIDKHKNISAQLEDLKIMKISYKAQSQSKSLVKDYGFPDIGKGLSEPEPRGTNMATIRDEALNYEPPKTLNIADLDKVSTEVDIKTKTAVDSEGKDFSYKYIVVDEIEYRVPTSVIIQLNEILSDKADTLWFSVKKMGEGLKTRYRVDPVSE